MENVQISKRRVIAQCLEQLEIEKDDPEYEDTVMSLKDKKLYELYSYYNQLKNTPRVRSFMSSVLKNIHAS